MHGATIKIRGNVRLNGTKHLCSVFSETPCIIRPMHSIQGTYMYINGTASTRSTQLKMYENTKNRHTGNS